MGKEDGMRKVRRFSISKMYADQDINRLEKSKESAVPVDNLSSLNSQKKTVALPPSGKRAAFNDAGPALQSPRWGQEKVSPRRSPRENRTASDDGPEPQSSRMRIRVNDRRAESPTNRQVPFNQVDSQPRFVVQNEQVRLLLFLLRVVN